MLTSTSRTIGYFLNNDIYRKLSPGVNLREFKNLLEASSMALEIVSSRGARTVKAEKPSIELQRYLDTFGVADGDRSLVKAATAV